MGSEQVENKWGGNKWRADKWRVSKWRVSKWRVSKWRADKVSLNLPVREETTNNLLRSIDRLDI